MKSGIKDEIAGKLHELKGDLKEKLGKLTSDPDAEAEGSAEKFAGTVQKKIGQAEKIIEKT
jgi:uncharacterized protein YjbJ (UPF0337 family)